MDYNSSILAALLLSQHWVLTAEMADFRFLISRITPYLPILMPTVQLLESVYKQRGIRKYKG